MIFRQSLPATERESHSGQEIRTLPYPPVVVKLGEKMADTALKSLDGTVHTLSDFKGKYLLIDFWSMVVAHASDRWQRNVRAGRQVWRKWNTTLYYHKSGRCTDRFMGGYSQGLLTKKLEELLKI
ncbi:TlpA family protein disulfide reductase [Pedobacter faecalis]|uniref:TlpA family protein disulfide reductase n=1 Tax=Pedobacter faecalis TaxID=3041495 RepID=UPI00254CA1CB|nr:hypothetical protein [Pedobacter sp. ELA7]